MIGRFNRGDSIGRYIVIERVGQGAMGVVYSAYDPQLDRKVALKVLRSNDLVGESDDETSSEEKSTSLLESPLTHTGVISKKR